MAVRAIESESRISALKELQAKIESLWDTAALSDPEENLKADAYDDVLRLIDILLETT